MFDSIIESMKNYTISEIHTDPSIVREHNLNLHALQIDMTIVEGPSETHRVYRLEDIFDKDAFKIVNWKDWDNNNKIIDIKKVEILNKQTINSKIKLNLFISVEEDITKIVEVKKITETE